MTNDVRINVCVASYVSNGWRPLVLRAIGDGVWTLIFDMDRDPIAKLWLDSRCCSFADNPNYIRALFINLRPVSTEKTIRDAMDAFRVGGRADSLSLKHCSAF